MPYNNPGMQPTGEHKPIQEILQEMDSVMLWQKKFNNKAMKMCQASGFNGFKRLHRFLAKKFMCWHLELENEAFDRFQIVLESDVDDFKYSAGDLPDHLKTWAGYLETGMEKLAWLTNEYRMITGLGNCVAEAALCKMAKNYEKACRWHKRFKMTNSMHDMYDFDAQLHEKYRKKEARDQNYN